MFFAETCTVRNAFKNSVESTYSHRGERRVKVTAAEPKSIVAFESGGSFEG